MKTNLTLKVLSLILVFALSFQAKAQLTFQIDAPASVEGTYDFAIANFGGDWPALCSTDIVSGDLMIVDDGDDEAGAASTTDACQMPINDLTGMVALLDRGTCSFDLKCYHAQEAGATAVVVCQNDPTEDPITMGIASPDTAAMITIPCLMIGYDDCQTIRMEIPTVTMSVFYQIPPPTNDPDNVIWGNVTGQGDFAGGLNGWTSTTIQCANGPDPLPDTWVWSPDASAEQGAYSGTGNAIGDGNTACNGAMAFDSDYYDNLGTAGNFGAGPCTPDAIGEIISPAIDLSAITAGLAGISVKWAQSTRQFNSSYFVSYSNDNGNTWFDVAVNAELETNSPHVKDEPRIFLPNADLSSTEFRIKFRYEANYYYWIIDDVKIIETEAHNTRVTDFYAGALNAQTPISQVDEFGFIADVKNAGAATQTGVNLNVTIVNDGNGAIAYTGDQGYGPLEADSLAENIVFGAYTPEMVLATYTGTYTVSADSVDFDPSDNNATFNFAITESTFAKETGSTELNRPGDGNWTNEPHSWTGGNYYHTPNGDGYKATSVDIAFDATGLAGESITIWLYEWSDANADEMVDEGERTRIGFNNLTFDGSEPVETLVNIPLLNFIDAPDDPILLADGGEYIVMVDFITEDLNLDFRLGWSDEYDYRAAIFRTAPDDPATTDILEGGNAGPPRFGPILGIGTETSYSTVAFGRDLCPVVRLNIAEDVVATSNLAEENVFEIFPVPASDYINVKLDLVNTSEQAVIQMMDANGKVIMKQKHQALQTELFRYDVNNLPAGNYFLQIVTDEGSRTESFLIQR